MKTTGAIVTKHPWAVESRKAHDDTQGATWRAALEEADGNITTAANKIGISRAHATRLMKKYALVEFAANLRVLAGMPRAEAGERKGVVAGRPRSRNPRQLAHRKS